MSKVRFFFSKSVIFVHELHEFLRIVFFVLIRVVHGKKNVVSLQRRNVSEKMNIDNE